MNNSLQSNARTLAHQVLAQLFLSAVCWPVIMLSMTWGQATTSWRLMEAGAAGTAALLALFGLLNLQLMDTLDSLHPDDGCSDAAMQRRVAQFSVRSCRWLRRFAIASLMLGAVMALGVPLIGQ